MTGAVARAVAAALGALAPLAALGAVAPPAAAQVETGSSVALAPEPGRRVLDHRVAPVRASGALTVAFASDPATCAAVGRCGLDGVVVWRPSRTGTLFVFDTADRSGGRSLDATLVTLSDGSGGADADAGTSAQVRRSAGGSTRVCTDHRESFSAVAGSSRGGPVRLGFGAGGAVLATQCAGPVDADAAALLPGTRLTRRELLAGRRTVDLSGERAFTAGGLTGTVRSTVRFAIGRPGRDEQDEVRRPPGPPTRSLAVTYRVTGLRGGLVHDLAGDPDPLRCARLDTCGLAGTVADAPVLRSGTVRFSADGPARVSAAALRAALAGRRPPPPGVVVGASGEVTVRATTTATVRPGGAPAPCVDRRTGGGFLAITGRPGGRARDGLALTPLGLPRTRCPAPVADPFGEHTTLTTAITRGTVGDRRLVLRAGRAARGAPDGFRVTTRPGLTLTLERVAVRERGRRSAGS